MTNRSKNRERSLSVAVAILFSMAFTGATAQETTFTQYTQAPIAANPSWVGTQSILMATAHHRSRKLAESASLNSSTLTIVAPLMNKDMERRWGGWGLSVMNHTLNADRSYKLLGATGAYAYNLPLYKDHFLGFGMQASYFHRKITLDGYTTGSQWDNSSGFDPSASIGENIDNETSTYFTGAAGFTYYIEDAAGRHLFYLGGSAFNINKPDISFSDNAETASVRYSGQLGVALLKNDRFLLGPELLYNRDNNVNIYHAGARGSYCFKNSSPFDVIKDGRVDLKAGYRVNNAVTLEAQFYQPNFSFGFSYDIAVSSGRQTGVYGNAFEVVLSLRKIISKRKQTRAGPKEYSNLGQVRKFYFNRNSLPQSKEGDRNDVETKAGEGGEINNLKQFGEGTFSFKLKKDFKFGFNDAALNDEAKRYLDEMADILKNNPNTRLEVIGHTDNTGNNAVNKRVATSRALSVVDYLTEQGIDYSRLKVTAMGAKEPLVPNDTEENRAQNRRVEFVIYGE